MGDKSDQAPSGIDPGMQKRPDGNASNGELQVIEHVKEDLVKSGVKREQAPRAASRVVEYVASYHSGPLPSVREFRGYEDICPGAARDILTMAQKDQDHEHRMDVVRVRGEIFLKFSGMVFVLLVFALMIGGAIYAAQGGHE
ncbi:MAG: DUF2335 domain-containing protein, partial [Methylocystis sp.]|nr:DUF2335 domain-containing protein [Methylocystis sp.]